VPGKVDAVTASELFGRREPQFGDAQVDAGGEDIR
jgi:hypothetical protein